MRQIDQQKKASIYLCVEVPFNNKVKIGRTSQTKERRLQSLQVGNPSKLKMDFFTDPIPFHREYENNLKIAYSDTKLRGEWFEISEWELDDLKINLQEDEEILLDTISDEFDLEGVKRYRK